MKKIYLLLSTIVIAATAMGQTLPNASFESWRTYTSGGSTPKVCRAPNGWYGADSLIIADGESFGSLLSIPDSVWKQQLFKDSVSVHSGTYSARLVTVHQDTAGNFPGILSNAQAHVTVSLTGLGPITYTGGTAVTYQPVTVSAWVKYTAGSATDSGLLTAQAISTVGGVDSVVGIGAVKIGPSTSFNQITANLFYPVSGFIVDTIRVTFLSSADTASGAINSTLWVDDVSMTGWPASVNNVKGNPNYVEVYPVPASDILHLESKQTDVLNCNLISVTGQLVATKTFSGKDVMDISSISTGVYFYTISSQDGKTGQSGKVTIAR